MKLAYGCCVAGILVTPFTVVAVVGVWAAEHRWQWLAALLFPHAMLLWHRGVGSQDLLTVVALAQFPIYGLVLAGAALTSRRALKLWSRILGMTHVIAVAGAATSMWARGG